MKGLDKGLGGSPESPSVAPLGRDPMVSTPLENGPELWDLILSRFPAGAIVAGGAVRDYLLGVPAKDVDVFLSVDSWPGAGLEGFERLGGDRDEEYAAMPTICIVQRGTVAGVQVDAVGVYFSDGAGNDSEFTAERVIETFDFGLTRCWYDGEIHDTPEARADRQARVVSLMLHDRPERAAKRFARFNERMGGGWALLSTGAPSPMISAEGVAAPQLREAI